MTMATPGGLMPAQPEKAERQIWLLQRTAGRPGARLNKTSGWVHRATLKNKNVAMIGGVSYDRIDDAGLHVTVDGKSQVLDVDNVIVCAGQEPNRQLHEALVARGVDVRLVGGADVAAELDAKRAIDKATRQAAAL
jgi:2,4-dienoyl-CoA reductase (NADPH2)